MILLNKNFNNSKNLYIFVHGAYDNLWTWRYLVDDLQNKKDSICILVNLPGYFIEQQSEKNIYDYVKKIYLFIQDINGYFEKIYLVGFSIGGIFSGLLCKELSQRYEVKLFLISIPIEFNPYLINLRIRIDSILNYVSNCFPRKWFPLNLRGKFKSSYSKYTYLRMASSQLDDLVDIFSFAKQVIILCGRLDPIAGSISQQLKLSYDLQNKGINSKFYDLGYTSHFPLLINRSKLVDFLCEE